MLRSTSNKGPCRLEKYADESAARCIDQHKVQLLSNVAAISRLSSRRHAFKLNFQDGSNRCFACDSELEADNWVKLITQECFLPSSGIANGEPDILKPVQSKELQEQFRVYLVPSKVETLYGECLLQVTHENIYLWDISSPKLKLCAWPLTALRRYGSDMTKFTFEAGRHCETGEGMFIFHTLEGEKIYRKVHQATLAIAEAHQRMKKGKESANPYGKSSNPLQSEVTTNFKFTTDLTASSEGLHQSEGNMNSSWYHSSSDNVSDVTASTCDVYSHHRPIESSPSFAIAH